MGIPRTAVVTRRAAAGLYLSRSVRVFPGTQPRLPHVMRVMASQAAGNRSGNRESMSEWRQEFEAVREKRRSDYRTRWANALEQKQSEAVAVRKAQLQTSHRSAASTSSNSVEMVPPVAQSSTSEAQARRLSRDAAPLTASSTEDVSEESVASASGTTCTVSFNLKFHAEFGQSLKIIGSCPALGSWDLSHAATMFWGPNDVWTTEIAVDKSSVLEYKYVLMDSYGQAKAWQQGNNGVLAIKPSQNELTVHDNWQGGPGSSVVSKDGTATRENQLLSWANDIEAMMSTTKNQLRHSRMELAAANEEIRVARMQNAHLKTELQVERAMGKRREAEIQELKEANMALSLQLNESNMGFKKALETAAVLLSELDEMSSGLVTMPADVQSKVAEEADTSESTSDILSKHSGSRGFVVAASAVSGTHWVPLELGEDSMEEESVRKQ